MVHGLIFAAGLGSRLKPLTDTMPKALVPLAGKTLLQWQVEKLRDAGITDITVNVHHFPDQIIEAVRQNEGWGTHITISDERDCLLDTGGGLRKAWHDGLLGTNEPILACNVDILSNINLRKFMDTCIFSFSSPLHGGNEGGSFGQLVVSKRQTQRYLLFDEQGMLRGWTNIATGEVKPYSLPTAHSPQTTPSLWERGGGKLSPLAFSGMQILSPDILNRLDEMPESKFSLIDFYLHLCEQNQKSEIKNQKSILKAYVPENYRMMDVGKIDQIEEAERFAESL